MSNAEIATMTVNASRLIIARGFTPGAVTVAAAYVHVASIENKGGATAYPDGDVWPTA